jgi:hypothetical protein
MKQTLLAVLFLAISGSAWAQPCTPDPLYADSVFGVWPDTTENFAAATIGLPYAQTLNLIVPAEAGLVDPQFAGLVIDSVGFIGITGLPNGLAVACNSQTPAVCTYITGQLGCGVITGTPTQIGTFPLSVNVLAHASIFGNVLSVPYSFTGYRIVVNDNSTAIEGPHSANQGQVRNVPNPFSYRTSFEFELGRSATVELFVFNLLGEELWSRSVAGRVGANRVQFDGQELPEGVYLYKMVTGGTTQTGRMIVNR